ncbi:hypothetical protein AZH51_01410 [Branchiibius sp. NY16-3462-2]|nr:hypothetical protein AZH51_01410 [Branchiibius sp. NY16-3462-2]
MDERLLPQLSIIGSYSIEWWEFSLLTAGDTVDPTIQRRVSEADLGLLLLSPGYFSSSYIMTKELPQLIERNLFVPVALRPFPHLDGGRTLGGLEKAWVIYGPNQRCYNELSGQAAKDRFALTVSNEVLRRLNGDGGWRSL